MQVLEHVLREAINPGNQFAPMARCRFTTTVHVMLWSAELTYPSGLRASPSQSGRANNSDADESRQIRAKRAR
jgi:hypothetical protein